MTSPTDPERADAGADSYRRPMEVRWARHYRTAHGPSSYPVCPRCRITLEREYQAYCDRCGQALSWEAYTAAPLLP